ncbi:MAG: dATP/dGTP diphosphohydrolase domain-containing protein [Oscillospiraceae bacterium]|nr:dATP/dGTP diphosphohydrolase domain-containing protein [Oscillospiraceae bacterium]
MNAEKCVFYEKVIPEGIHALPVCKSNFTAPPKIIDSGNRRQFETGAVRDIQEGKGRCDLLPLDVIGDIIGSKELRWIEKFKTTGDIEHLHRAILLFECDYEDEGTEYEKDMIDIPTKLLEVSKHFEEGAKKYGENNWQKGIPTHCYIDSAVRHYLKWCREDVDEPHDRAYIWNLLCCIWTCEHKPELNDYLKEGNQNGE